MFNSLVKGAFGSRDTTRGSPHTLDVRHTMKQRLLLATLLLTSCACVADGWQLECLDLSNAHECAMRYEASVANEFPDLFTRNRASLTITLKDGSKKVINDPTARLNVVRVHAPSHTVIVREQYSEGHAWHILDLESGVSTEIGGFPVFSPDSRLFFAIEPVTESDYNDAVAVVFLREMMVVRRQFGRQTARVRIGALRHLSGIAAVIFPLDKCACCRVANRSRMGKYISG